MLKLDFIGIGTTWKIDIPHEEYDPELVDSIKNLVRKFELTYSRFLPDSTINKISKSLGTHALSKDSKLLFDLYFDLYKTTQGVFTPLIGGVLEDLGYDKDYTLKPSEVRDLVSLDTAFDYSFPTITTKQSVQLDFGAAGKGYLVDKVAGLLESQGIFEYTIDAGRDFLYKSPDLKLKIGLENPLDFTKAIGVAEIENGSLCCSSGSLRKWDGFHHIIDPQTKKSPYNVIATWVYAKKAFIADALSTCLFLVQPSVLETKFDFEYVILHKDFTFDISSNFPGGLFTS